MYERLLCSIGFLASWDFQQIKFFSEHAASCNFHIDSLFSLYVCSILEICNTNTNAETWYVSISDQIFSVSLQANKSAWSLM